MKGKDRLNGNNDRHRNMYEDPVACLFWWYDLVIFICMFPSNAVLVWIRSGLGYRLMKPWVFWTIFLVLMGTAMSGLSASALTGEGAAGNYAVLIYALGMGVLAFYHRKRGWTRAFDPVDPLHSMSRGDSYLAKFLPFVPEWIIQRYVEPIALALLGYGLVYYCHWVILGFGLMIAAACLAVVEAVVLEKAINVLLDARDAKIEARYIKEMDDAVAGRGQTQKKVGGLATLSPELVKLRRERLASGSFTPTSHQGVVGHVRP